jgi:hypothetical protein
MNVLDATLVVILLFVIPTSVPLETWGFSSPPVIAQAFATTISTHAGDIWGLSSPAVVAWGFSMSFLMAARVAWSFKTTLVDVWGSNKPDVFVCGVDTLAIAIGEVSWGFTTAAVIVDVFALLVVSVWAFASSFAAPAVVFWAVAALAVVASVTRQGVVSDRPGPRRARVER